MKQQIIIIMTLLWSVCISFSQQQSVSGQRIYSIGVVEMSEHDSRLLNDKFDARKKKIQESDRGLFMQALLAANRSAFVSKITTSGETILGAVVSKLGEDLKSPRGKWEKTVNKESNFTISLSMPEEIQDFYSDISSNGPLDAENMIFDGFVCRQDISVDNDTVNVFYVSCKLDTSKVNRMLAHSKFELYVDSVRFNPFLCDLPNDSVNDLSKRIAFDFKNRENLRLRLHADITSSWINEGVMIFRDQKLGEFDVEVKIDSAKVFDGVYTYKAGRDLDKADDISIKGECFVVPRSYSGNDRDGNSIWGTGQYKVNMVLSESCRIKKSYYMAEGGNDWNDNWQPEWKLICSRKKGSDIWKTTWSTVKTKWTGSQWLTEITSPTTTYLIKQGGTFLNGGVDL